MVPVAGALLSSGVLEVLARGCGADSGVMPVLKIVDLTCVCREELSNGRFRLLLFDGVLLLQGLLLVKLNELVPSKELRFGSIVKVSKLKAKTYQLNAGKVKRGVILTSECPDRSVGTLPTELWFNILVLLPADVLYNVMRYICSQWYKIIHDPVFIKTHLLRTNAGLFIKGCASSPDAYYADTSTVDVTVERINFQFSSYVWCSCDGLVLFSDPNDLTILHIVNPITKQQVTLPPFVQLSYFVSHCVLARGCSTGEYKVVGSCLGRGGKVLHCVILTVGKDLTWREIDTHHFSMDHQQMALKNRPRCAGGYVFWTALYYPDFLTLDVEAEVLLHFPIPRPDNCRCHVFYGEMGNSICCIFWPYNSLVFDVLVLSDPSSGKWENLYKLDLEGKRRMINSSLMREDASPRRKLHVRPIAWVNNGKVVVLGLFDPCTKYVAHNVETGETYSFDMYQECLVHVNSLVSLEM